MIVHACRNELIYFLHLCEHGFHEAVSVPTAVACPWWPCQAMPLSVGAADIFNRLSSSS